MADNQPARLPNTEHQRLAADVADALGEVEQLWSAVPSEVVRLELHHILTRYAVALGPQVTVDVTPHAHMAMEAVK